jgi:hypothetical protein
MTDRLDGGLADNKYKKIFNKKQLEKGTKVEQEHTKDKDLAEEIASDHLVEDPVYYDHLQKMEEKYQKKKSINNFNFKKLIADRIDDNLPQYVKNNQHVLNDMEKLENEYFPYYYAQDGDDIDDDMGQPGAVGVGIFDDQNKINGWLYGYKFIYNDNAQGVLNLDNLTCYSDECKDPKFIDNIKKLCKKKKILYVSNFMIEKGKRNNINNVLVEFLNKVRQTNYQYLGFDALSDTYRLIFKNGQPRQDRLDKYGLELICAIQNDESTLILMKLKNTDNPKNWYDFFKIKSYTELLKKKHN